MLRYWLKTFLWMGCYCAAFVVPLTAQNTTAEKSTEAHTAPTVEPRDDVQGWPDSQIIWRLKPPFSLILFGSLRRGQHNDTFISKQIGGGFNWAFHPHFSFGAQYRHIISTPTPTRRSVEERFQAELTPRTSLRAGFALSDRNRLEIRRLNGDVSFRFRNRVQIERPFNLGFNGHEHRFVPYISYELYYDSRTQSFVRQQIFTGARTPLVNHLTLNGFYMRQLDGQSRPGYLHVIGSFLQFDF